MSLIWLWNNKTLISMGFLVIALLGAGTYIKILDLKAKNKDLLIEQQGQQLLVQDQQIENLKLTVDNKTKEFEAYVKLNTDIAKEISKVKKSYEDSVTVIESEPTPTIVDTKAIIFIHSGVVTFDKSTPINKGTLK